jgi:hypothetical protein
LANKLTYVCRIAHVQFALHGEIGQSAREGKKKGKKKTEIIGPWN